ncbi:hypothetical protein DFS34DRAFT_581173 [Phlyctochytrium arcticum]|nr:hypothetical protein DFS34DRAFT_581173 [Phlyctochytrium arcticum]
MYSLTLAAAHEEECLRNAYNLKSWLRYIAHTKEGPLESQFFIYERAVKELPGSYKLWRAYLDLRVSVLLGGHTNKETGLRSRKRHPLDPEWQQVNNCFERSLVLCNKFPVIWLLYGEFLMHQANPTRCRRTFDRALQALAPTQHERIWALYLKFAKNTGGDTAVRVWRRYIKLKPEDKEDYVDVLMALEPPRHAEAARVLASLVEDPKFTSKHGKSPYQLWTELCDLITDNPLATLQGEDDRRVEKLDAEKVIRSGISRFTDQVGRLWNSLARWWMLQQEWEKARDIYEEAIRSVKTVRDFSMVFDAYAAMEEVVLSRQMQELAENDPKQSGGPDDVDIDLRLARFEKLMARRPFLVNDVLLRQNPHNVTEWEKRVELFQERDNQKMVVQTYEDAIATVNPKRASGKLNMLWVHYAGYYEARKDLDTARAVFERAIKAPFKRVDELADVWINWAETEMRHKNINEALDVMGRATAPPRGTATLHASIRYTDEHRDAQQRLFKSQKLWAFYVDLEESVGTLEGTRAVYDRIMELKIATPQIIINYATFLEDNKWFEECFRVYERGIDLFGYPIAFDIWNIYLTKFIERYAGTKLERARDLFEHAVDKVPPKFAKPLYLMYAKLEEDYGLARHAMRVYDRATRAVGEEDRFEMYKIYIAKATSYFGLTSTREIYQRAIEALPDKQARDMCVDFANVETKLGEIDRARAILGFGSQFCDPRMDAEFWDIWQSFEVKHGNEDTFKEMLRIKRSIQAKYNTEVNFISAQMLAARQNGQVPSHEEEEEPTAAPTTMEELEAEAKRMAVANGDGQGQSGTRVVGFVRAKKTEAPRKSDADSATRPSTANADEIQIEDDDSDSSSDEEEEEDANAMDVDKSAKIAGFEKKAIPEGVFGGLGADAAQADEKLGAKERFKRKR